MMPDPRPADRSDTTILVVDDDSTVRQLVAAVLGHAGWTVEVAHDGEHAWQRLSELTPDLILCDVNMPLLSGFEFLRRLRSHPLHAHLPMMLLTTRRHTDDLVTGMELGADDYLTKPFSAAELLARVQGHLNRPPTPHGLLATDRNTGLTSLASFQAEFVRELERVRRGGRGGAVAVISIQEIESVRYRLGPAVATALVRKFAAPANRRLDPLDLIAYGGGDRLLLLLPDREGRDLENHIAQLQRHLTNAVSNIRGTPVRATPSLGYTPFTPALLAEGAHIPSETLAAGLLERAEIASLHANSDLDLIPRLWTPAMHAAPRRSNAGALQTIGRGLRLLTQVAIAVTLGLLLPFAIYVHLDAVGRDISPYAYLVIALTLTGNALLVLLEGLLASRVVEPPLQPAEPEPPATAIIAAYLPNESATILATVEAFRRIKYPAGLQIIVAYNTPQQLPVERDLAELARRDPRVVALHVAGSTSKAQNVNAALERVTGRFVGMFDADHHPAPDAFSRAWRWLSHGYDVVQGHCLVRNGHASFVARMVAVEFEAMYAVTHPGRARLHGFAIFGGSNGFWKLEWLHAIRMRGRMLTEDIDASLRILEEGGRIRSDPGLISSELATTSWRHLWHQRLRWAQGWFQVSLRHLGLGLRSPHLSPRQKLGLIHLFAWREFSPWLAWQVWPLIAFWVWRGDAIEWLVPIGVLTTLVTLSVGPLYALLAYRLSHPSIRVQRAWFWTYFWSSALFYQEFKGIISRFAQLKELFRERAWRVTPRNTQGRAAARGDL